MTEKALLVILEFGITEGVFLSIGFIQGLLNEDFIRLCPIRRCGGTETNPGVAC
jgi:hypothetical protein